MGLFSDYDPSRVTGSVQPGDNEDQYAGYTGSYDPMGRGGPPEQEVRGGIPIKQLEIAPAGLQGLFGANPWEQAEWWKKYKDQLTPEQLSQLGPMRNIDVYDVGGLAESEGFSPEVVEWLSNRFNQYGGGIGTAGDYQNYMDTQWQNYADTMGVSAQDMQLKDQFRQALMNDRLDTFNPYPMYGSAKDFQGYGQVDAEGRPIQGTGQFNVQSWDDYSKNMRSNETWVGRDSRMFDDPIYKQLQESQVGQLLLGLQGITPGDYLNLSNETQLMNILGMGGNRDLQEAGYGKGGFMTLPGSTGWDINRNIYDYGAKANKFTGQTARQGTQEMVMPDGQILYYNPNVDSTYDPAGELARSQKLTQESLTHTPKEYKWYSPQRLIPSLVTGAMGLMGGMAGPSLGLSGIA